MILTAVPFALGNGFGTCPFSEISRGSEEDPGVPYDRFNESVRSNHRGVGLLSWTSLGKVICGEMTGLRQKG